MGIKNKLLALVAISALAVTGLTGCSASSDTPDELVTKWFQAVQKGDAETALRIIPVENAIADASLLTNSTLQKAKPISSFTVAKQDAVDDTVSKTQVKATYTAPGIEKPVALTFDAVKKDGKWSITKGAYQTLGLQFGELAQEYELDGQPIKNKETIPADGYLPYTPYLLFPGTYTVSLPGSNENIDLKPATVVPGNSVGLDSAKLSDAAVSTLSAEYKSFLDNCFAASRDARNLDCPNWYKEPSLGANASDISWQLEKYEFVPVLNGGLVNLESSVLNEKVSYAEGAKHFSSSVRKNASIKSQKVDEFGKIQITYSFSPAGPEQQSDLNYDTAAKFADRWI